jgi:inhibitor of KinA
MRNTNSKIYAEPLFKPSGDRGVRITFGDERSLEVNRPVQGLSRMLETAVIPGVEEIVPTYASVTVMYRPNQVDYSTLVDVLKSWTRRSLEAWAQEPPYRVIVIPVCYLGEYSPDLDYVCEYTGLTAERVIQIHTECPYYVFQLGFTPGCPFLGPLQDVLHVPLMQSPRTHTPAGAVAISVGQTVIYPRATPGGMRVIGRTPVHLFQVEHPELTLLKPGDRVSFRPISVQDYKALETQVRTLFDGVEVRENVYE